MSEYKGYYILSLYPKVAKKVSFQSLFVAGYFGDPNFRGFKVLYPFLEKIAILIFNFL
jgi:hypothetical protein